MRLDAPPMTLADCARQMSIEREAVAAAAKIRARIAALEAIRANYLGYLRCRIDESDWHGSWDASVNISETECEIAGLQFALEAISG